jgi:hypothetical protein
VAGGRWQVAGKLNQTGPSRPAEIFSIFHLTFFILSLPSAIHHFVFAERDPSVMGK